MNKLKKLEKKLHQKAFQKREYSVWVGGGEVNNTYLTKEEAKKLAKKWKQQGYDDVAIRKEI